MQLVHLVKDRVLISKKSIEKTTMVKNDQLPFSDSDTQSRFNSIDLKWSYEDPYYGISCLIIVSNHRLTKIITYSIHCSLFTACYWSAIIYAHFLICTWYDNSVNNKVWQTALWRVSFEDNIRQSSKLARLSVPKAAKPFAKENMTCAKHWLHNAVGEMSVQEVNLQSQRWRSAVVRKAEVEQKLEDYAPPHPTTPPETNTVWSE